MVCHHEVENLLEAGVPVKHLYEALFQRSLYEVGELWLHNRISVAREHRATAIIESLFHLTYPTVFATERVGKKALISCGANEYHQVGGKIVADILELNGWDGHFLGAHTPIEDLQQCIQSLQPDFVGLSLALVSNIGGLLRTIDVLRVDFPNLDLLIGGQAFLWGGIEAVNACTGTTYIPSLNDLELAIKR